MYDESMLQDGPPKLTTSMSSSIYQAWDSFRGSNKIPHRSEIDPLLFPKNLVPYIWIYEFDEEHDSFRRVLAGEEVIQAWGKTTSHPLLEDFMTKECAIEVRQHWLFLCKVPALSYFTETANMFYSHIERIAFPIINNDGQVNVIFGCSYYKKERTNDAVPPKINHQATTLYRI